MTAYLVIDPKIEQAARDFLAKYGDGRSEALDDLRQLLMTERERGMRDVVADVRDWLREPDPVFDAASPNAVRVVKIISEHLDSFYLRGNRIAVVVRGKKEDR